MTEERFSQQVTGNKAARLMARTFIENALNFDPAGRRAL
jgi:hypothetical protein